MKWKIFNIKLGDGSPSPNAFKRDPSIAAAVISGAAALGSTAMSGIQASNLTSDNRNWQQDRMREQMQFNAKEAQLARMNQIRLLHDEQNWQENMYNMYNSPSALRRQYEAAGYHPYLGASSGASGHGLQGSPSAPSSPQAQAPSVGSPASYMPDYSLAANGLSDAARMYFDSKVANANAANQSSQALTNVAKAYNELRASGMSHEDAQKLTMPFMKSTQGFNSDDNFFYKNLELNVDRTRIARDKEQLEQTIYAEFGRTEKANEVMNQVQLWNKMAAEIGMMSSNAKVNEAKIDELAASVKAYVAKARLDNANSNILEQAVNSIVDSYRYSAKQKLYEADTAEGEYGIKKPIYNAAKTDAGQTAEQIDYYTNKIVDKIGKVTKVNIGFGNNKVQSTSTSTVNSNSHSSSVSESYIHRVE